MSVGRPRVHYLVVGVVLLVGALSGCQSAQRETGSKPGTTPAATDARIENSIATSDGERAKAALERDWPTGERRPAAPPRRPVVDQPRPPRR